MSLSCDPDFPSRAQPGVRGLTPYKPGKPLVELEREYGIRDAVKLASNENPLGPGERVLEALRAAMPELSRYPDGNGFALKQVLAARLDVDPRGITLGNGSNDVLELVARAFLGPGTEAVFSEHAFAVYPIVTQAVGARARVVPAGDGRRAPRFGHDLEAMAGAVGEDTRVLFIANPNNPTGTHVDGEALQALLERVPGDVLVVLDEAYVEYVEAGDWPDSLPWLARHPNLVITRTFSKAHGLAGLRVGYALSHPQVADLLNRVRQPFNAWRWSRPRSRSGMRSILRAALRSIARAWRSGRRIAGNRVWTTFRRWATSSASMSGVRPARCTRPCCAKG